MNKYILHIASAILVLMSINLHAKSSSSPLTSSCHHTNFPSGVLGFSCSSISSDEVLEITFNNKAVTVPNQSRLLHVDFPHSIYKSLERADSLHFTVDSIKISRNHISDFYYHIKANKQSDIVITAFKDGDTLSIGGKSQMVLDLFPQTLPPPVFKPVFTNTAVVFGIMCLILGIIFYTNGLPAYKKFYTFFPALVLCYLIPSLLNTWDIVNGHSHGVYPAIKNFLLPASLVLMTLGIDFKGLSKLKGKALIMFFTATLGIIIGGPLAIMLVSTFSPDTVGGEGFDAAWRGLATLAGSWIGGGANQTAMLETYQYNIELYSGMVAVDIGIAAIWMTVLLYGAERSKKIDKWLKADASSIEQLKNEMSDYQSSISKVPVSRDLMIILGIAFTAVGLSHFFSDSITQWIAENYPNASGSPFASGFFWIVVISTTCGLLLSTTRLRNYEGAGASKIATVFIYLLVIAIGMKIDLMKIVEKPLLLLVGLIWMAIHVLILVIVAKLIRAPFFFVAVGSKANVGGAASAPVVAAAFHPSLAPVGALLAVLGYAVGTYGAIICAQMMQAVAP